jgi:hypothetical protein
VNSQSFAVFFAQIKAFSQLVLNLSSLHFDGSLGAELKVEAEP